MDDQRAESICGNRSLFRKAVAIIDTTSSARSRGDTYRQRVRPSRLTSRSMKPNNWGRGRMRSFYAGFASYTIFADFFGQWGVCLRVFTSPVRRMIVRKKYRMNLPCRRRRCDSLAPLSRTFWTCSLLKNAFFHEWKLGSCESRFRVIEGLVTDLSKSLTICPGRCPWPRRRCLLQHAHHREACEK